MKIHQNLLPAEFQQRLLISVRLRQWCKIWMLMVLVLTVFGLRKYIDNHQLQMRWHLLEASTDPIVQAKLRNDAISKQLVDLQSKISLIEGVHDATHHLGLIGVISQSARSTGDSIQIEACSFQELTPVATQKPNVSRPRNRSEKLQATVDEKIMKIELRGLSVDERSIARFVKALKNIEAFTHVELKSVRGAEVSKQRYRSYQIECAL